MISLGAYAADVRGALRVRGATPRYGARSICRFRQMLRRRNNLSFTQAFFYAGRVCGSTSGGGATGTVMPVRMALRMRSQAMKAAYSS